MLNVPSPILALFAVHSFLGVLCLAAARGDDRLRAVRYWGWGMLAYAGGILIGLLATWIGRGTTAALGNSLVAYAAIPSALAVMTHAGRRLNLRWTAAALALVVAILLWNNEFGPQLHLINLTAPTLFATALALLSSVALLRRPVSTARNASNVLGSIMIAAAGMWLLRVFILWGLLDVDANREQAVRITDLFGIVQILISVMGVMCLFWIEVLKMEHTLKSLAYGDPLTGLANRRATTMRFEELLSLASRTRQSLALAVFDIDFFKKVNDVHGHQTGDEVLKLVSSLLTEASRHEDFLGRVGGEEFVVLLPNTDMAGGQTIAERMRQWVAAGSRQTGNERTAVTISGGLAVFPEDGDSWDRIFASADRRLYSSKSAGRNRVTTAG